MSKHEDKASYKIKDDRVSKDETYINQCDKPVRCCPVLVPKLRDTVNCEGVSNLSGH
jgi:hypothetical protein